MGSYSKHFWASLVAQLVKNPPVMQEIQIWFLGWEDPLEKGQATHSSIHGLPWWSDSKESPAVQETWVWSLGWENPRRRIWQLTPVFLPVESLWTEDPGGLQFMGPHTVGHDWVTKHSPVNIFNGWIVFMQFYFQFCGFFCSQTFVSFIFAI